MTPGFWLTCIDAEKAEEFLLWMKDNGWHAGTKRDNVAVMPTTTSAFATEVAQIAVDRGWATQRDAIVSLGKYMTQFPEYTFGVIVHRQRPNPEHPALG